MMNREELLRELELLPVWQLRSPVQQAPSEADVLVNRDNVDLAVTDPDMVIEASQGVPDARADLQFRLILSDDAQWAFVLGSLDDEGEQLLQNMLKAVAVKVSQDITNAKIEQLKLASPKVIVIMAEHAARQMLNNTQTIDQMRGTPLLWQGASVIVTYSPHHLLSNLADKAKAWQDLCLARLTIANL